MNNHLRLLPVLGLFALGCFPVSSEAQMYDTTRGTVVYEIVSVGEFVRLDRLIRSNPSIDFWDRYTWEKQVARSRAFLLGWVRGLGLHGYQGVYGTDVSRCAYSGPSRPPIPEHSVH